MPPLDRHGLLPHDTDLSVPKVTPRPPWRDRLGTYLLGVGIGVLLVIMFVMARAASKAP